VLLPRDNERDVKMLDPAWTRGLKFEYFERFEEVYAAAFGGRPGAGGREKR